MTIATLAMSLLAAVPVFEGFEAKRCQQHDAIIAKCVREFNRHRGAWADANRGQARTIPNITEEMVKAHMIQETGGGDKRSLAAWNGDPLQVNVPGGWTAALRNYNGRTGKTVSGKKYNAEYADRIIKRAAKRDRHVEIEIKIRK